MKKWMKLMTLTLSTFALLTGGTSVFAQKSLEEIKDSGKLVVGTSADFPPFEWVLLDGGESKFVGIDVDLAQLIADKIGVELEIQDTSFDGLIPSVSSGRIDAVLAGVTYSEERAKQVNFSDVYYETASKFIVATGQESEYTKLEDFATLKIGVQKGTIQESTLKELLPEAELVSMNKNGDLVEALKAKRVDAVLMDGIVVNEFAELNKDSVSVLDDIQVEKENEGFSVVVAKGSQDLVDVINQVIKDAKESGQLEEFVTINTELNAETAE